ncbi:hypothetical protein SLA2020_304840 [Shorea laevis]
MASSSLFSTCTLDDGSFGLKAISFKKELMCCHLFNKLPAYSRVLTSEKSIKWNQNQNPPRNATKCNVLAIENSLSFPVVAREMEKIEKKSPGSQILKGYLMATLFYEPSTRTRPSFESAMKRLGGEVLTTENAREFSSAAKGETLEDTIRIVEGYSDIIVMRHFESGAAKRAAATAGIPIVNAGDGPGQHPTQALLDVYTIQREIGRLDGIRVGLVGDLANGRTVRSLAYLLAKYQNVKIYFVSPDVVKMKDDIKEERFAERIDLYEEARGKYIVNHDVVKAMQKHAVVMHPLPRLDEITADVDTDPRAAYFRQAKNGLYIRMALLKLLLVGW